MYWKPAFNILEGAVDVTLVNRGSDRGGDHLGDRRGRDAIPHGRLPDKPGWDVRGQRRVGGEAKEHADESANRYLKGKMVVYLSYGRTEPAAFSSAKQAATKRGFPVPL